MTPDSWEVGDKLLVALDLRQRAGSWSSKLRDITDGSDSQGGRINAGQTSAALNRLYVHDSLSEEMIDALAHLANTVRIDNGPDPGAALGSLQNQAQFDIVAELVEDAKPNGRGHRMDQSARSLGLTVARVATYGHWRIQ